MLFDVTRYSKNRIVKLVFYVIESNILSVGLYSVQRHQRTYDIGSSSDRPSLRRIQLRIGKRKRSGTCDWWATAC